jgi:putative transcriptional regulator
MPIKVKLDLMLVRRKMSLTELSSHVGVSLAKLSILKTDKARAVRSSTLAAICDGLECYPARYWSLARTPERQPAGPAISSPRCDNEGSSGTRSGSPEPTGQ